MEDVFALFPNVEEVRMLPRRQGGPLGGSYPGPAALPAPQDGLQPISYTHIYAHMFVCICACVYVNVYIYMHIWNIYFSVFIYIFKVKMPIVIIDTFLTLVVQEGETLADRRNLYS